MLRRNEVALLEDAVEAMHCRGSTMTRHWMKSSNQLNKAKSKGPMAARSSLSIYCRECSSVKVLVAGTAGVLMLHRLADAVVVVVVGWVVEGRKYSVEK